MQLHKGPLLAVIGPMATSYLTDDHTLRCWRGAGADVLPQRGGWSNLSRSMYHIYDFKGFLKKKKVTFCLASAQKKAKYLKE